MAYWGEVEIIQNSQSVSGNYSNVTVNYYACTDTGSSYSGYATYPYLGIYYGDKEYAETKTLSSFNFGTNKKTYLGSLSMNIPHNDDGTMTISASFTWNSGHSLVGTVTGSNSKTLTTIPRTSTPSISGDMTIGNTITIYTNRASSSFTHTLRYSWGSISEELIAREVGSSITWTIPKSLANHIPYATAGTGTILCKTYSGSTLIGTKSIPFTAYVPDTAEFKPSVSSISLSEAVSGIASKFEAFIQNQSKIHCVVAGAGAYSSVINTCKVTINGTTYGTHDFTTDFLKLAGTNTVSVTVTDTRNRQATATQNFEVLAYTGPTITKIIANRCLQNGTLNDEGEFAKIELSATVIGLNYKNVYGYYFKYKDSDVTQYTDYAITLTESRVNNNFVLSGSIIIPADPDNSFDYLFYVGDYFKDTGNRTTSVESIFQLINFNASGKGMAIGKVSEKDAFEVGMDMEVKGHKVQYSDVIQLFNSGQISINVDTAWTSHRVSFTNCRNRSTVFNFDDSKVIVNEKGYIDIDMQLNVFLSGYANGDYALHIYKNGANLGVGGPYFYGGSTDYYESISGSSYGIRCEAGDFFEMYLTVGGTGTVKTFAGDSTSFTLKFRRSQDE